MPMALEGIRILDLTIYQHGPGATTYLADLGAEVIKVEGPNNPDPGRPRSQMQAIGASVADCPETEPNYYFEILNRNKKAIALDLKPQAGKEVFYRLVERSDVFVSNYRRAMLAKLGLDYATLQGYNPRLIYACGHGYGPEGPDRDKPALDALAQARGGLMHQITESGQPPTDAGVGASDQIGALTLALGILAALMAREQHGVGQRVDTSLLGSTIYFQGFYLQNYLLSGSSPRKMPRDNRNASPFWRVYRCGDGRWLHFAILRTDPVWPGICRALEITEYEKHPSYASHELRIQNSASLIAMFERILATRPAREWVQRLQAEGAMCDLVQDYADLASDPQVLANEYVTEMELPDGSRRRVPGLPIKLSATPGRIRLPAPALGEHTDEILREVAGYSQEEIARLRNLGIVK
ncbi:MAG TPA: CoA transferase [Dehalococcoidia bacterium]|nr:CoA transferase [Dehalococcoidia bacterium]